LNTPAPDLSDLTVAEIVQTYFEAATEHGRASETADSSAGNQPAQVVAAAYGELRTRGPEAQRALLVLLDHPDAGVRSWAAAHALDFAPEEGEPVLEDLARAADVVGFNAKMTLEAWKRGELKFP
jgi:hypothetical protein